MEVPVVLAIIQQKKKTQIHQLDENKKTLTAGRSKH